MIEESELTTEEMQTPVGIIFRNNPSAGFVEKKKWNPHYKEWDYFFDYDKSLINADDDSAIGKDCCRCCKNKIEEKYSEVFYQRLYDYNQWYSYRLCYDTNYCKGCAIKKSRICKSYGWNPALAVVKREYVTPIGEDYGTVIEIKHMADGSTIEDMTPSEKARNVVRE